MSMGDYFAGASAEMHISATIYEQDMAQLRSMAEQRIGQLNAYIAELERNAGYLRSDNDRLEAELADHKNRVAMWEWWSSTQKDEKKQIKREREVALATASRHRQEHEKDWAAGFGLSMTLREEGRAAVSVVRAWAKEQFPEAPEEVLSRLDAQLRERMPLTFELEACKDFWSRIATKVDAILYESPEHDLTNEQAETIRQEIEREFYAACRAGVGE